MNIEFKPVHKGELISVTRDGVFIAGLSRLEGRSWRLIEAGGVVARGTISKVKQAAIARYCTCEECRAERLAASEGRAR